MTNRQTRVVTVVVILLLGIIWVMNGRRTNVGSPAEASSPSTEFDAAAPFASGVTDDTALVRYVKEHPSPVGERAVEALKDGKAVVLVGLPTDRSKVTEVLGWVTECSDYCKVLATRIDFDATDPAEQALLAHVESANLKAPFLVGIAPSGEVSQRVAGELTRQQVIDVFAEVTGSCGVECTNGCG